MGLAAHLRPQLRYGASRLHLAGHVAAIVVSAYALSRVLQPSVGRPLDILVWLIGGALLHDLVFLPLYTLLDRIARAAVGGRVALLNHIRVPAVISGTLLLVYFPLILAKAPEAYERNTGRHPPDYAARWLAITAALFAVSAVLYALRDLRSGRRRRLGR
jgi:hypothetical protein